MERNVEFATQLAHLVAIYAQPQPDGVAEKAALRAARGATKHGAIALSMEEGTLRAGHHTAEGDPGLTSLQALFATLGVTRATVGHLAEQEEIKHLAKLLGDVQGGRLTAPAFASALAGYAWGEVRVETVLATLTVPDTAATSTDLAAGATLPAGDMAEAKLAGEATHVLAPDSSVIAEPSDVTAQADAPPIDERPVIAPPTDAASYGMVALPDAALEELAQGPAVAEATGPLATELPPGVAELAGPTYRGLFERLITSSEPGTLRNLLEPVHSAIEQSVRDGATADAVHLLQAMFLCENCAADAEMRRQFVLVLRRLTKPTLLRAFAMLHGDVPEEGPAVEQVLSRFGEDGAEAVVERFAGASTAELRSAYIALLRRLPSTPDALAAMLDDERVSVAERAIHLAVQTGHPDMERLLGEQLGHANPRVREAAARGLSTATASAFAADALLRAVQDAAPEVRLAAAVALQWRREARLATAIVARIDEEPELEVQLALVAALGRIAAPEGVQKLVALSNPDQRALRRRGTPVLRLGAIEAMGEARTPAAMVALQKLLEDRDEDVREAAARLYTRARRQTAAAGMTAITDG